MNALYSGDQEGSDRAVLLGNRGLGARGRGRGRHLRAVRRRAVDCDEGHEGRPPPDADLELHHEIR